MYQKLLSKYREREIIKGVIEKFLELGYLNDYDYAESYINSHNYSKKKMEFMLLQKGISSDIIGELLESSEFQEIDEIKRQWKNWGIEMRRKRFSHLCERDLDTLIFKEQSRR